MPTYKLEFRQPHWIVAKNPEEAIVLLKRALQDNKVTFCPELDEIEYLGNSIEIEWPENNNLNGEVVERSNTTGLEPVVGSDLVGSNPTLATKPLDKFHS